MTDIEQLEYPLPTIKADVDKLYIEASGSFEGSFWIRNAGGSELNGRITSNSRGLKFLPQNFNGNKIEIKYKFNLDIYKKGDIIQTSALIMSNGGEVIIPVTIHIIAPAVKTKDGDKITSLKDFLFYAKKDPLESRRLFSQKEFMMWLLSINYENMDMYEHFNKDPNKERAVDNFLVFNGLKNRAELTLIENKINISIKPFENDPVTGVIPIKLKGWGFIDADVVCQNSLPWLRLMTNKITASDFDENGFFEASFIIYPNLIKKRTVSEKVKLVHKDEEEVYISVCREHALNIRLDKNSYSNEDSGKIIVTNNTFKDLMLEIYPKDSFLRFEGKRYLVGANAEIPFSIKFSALQNAQYSLKKQIIIETGIAVRTYINEKRWDKALDVSIGNLYI